MDPNKEQQLTTTQETRKDVREVPGGEIPIQKKQKPDQLKALRKKPIL